MNRLSTAVLLVIVATASVCVSEEGLMQCRFVLDVVKKVHVVNGIAIHRRGVEQLYKDLWLIVFEDAVKGGHTVTQDGEIPSPVMVMLLHVDEYRALRVENDKSSRVGWLIPRLDLSKSWFWCKGLNVPYNSWSDPVAKEDAIKRWEQEFWVSDRTLAGIAASAKLPGMLARNPDVDGRKYYSQSDIVNAMDHNQELVLQSLDDVRTIVAGLSE